MTPRDTAISRHTMELRFARQHLACGERDLAFMAFEAASHRRADLAEAKAENNTNQHDGERR